jgi:hypothetical protein
MTQKTIRKPQTKTHTDGSKEVIHRYCYIKSDLSLDEYKNVRIELNRIAVEAGGSKEAFFVIINQANYKDLRNVFLQGCLDSNG